jgi:hypothetical protein
MAVEADFGEKNADRDLVHGELLFPVKKVASR